MGDSPRATITAATMTVNIVSGTSTANNAKAFQVTGGEWTSSTLQWSNKPVANISLEENISHNNKTKYQFSCLAAVQHWYDGDTTGQNENYGIMLCYQDPEIADYNSFYSADCTDANSRPALTISYNPPNSTLDVDEGKTLTLSVSGALGAVTWTSSDTSIATVNSDGVVSGIRAGKAIITAYAGGAAYETFTVYVTVADGVYYVKYAGLCLGITGRVFENATVSMYEKATSGGARLRQLWKIAYLGDGFYTIRPMYRLSMGLHTSSSIVDIARISENNSLEEVQHINRWMITYNENGYMFLQAGISSRTMKAERPYPGTMVSIDEPEPNSYDFNWELEETTYVEEQLILIDLRSGTISDTIEVEAYYGARMSLADLNVAVSFVSEYTNLQQIEYSTLNPANIQYDQTKEKVIGVEKSSEGILVASRSFIGNSYLYNKQITIKVSEAPNSPPLKPQEKSNWCWVASAQMLALNYEPSISKTQSDAVNSIFGSTLDKKGTAEQTAETTEYFLESVGNNTSIGYTELGTIITKESLIRFIDAGHSIIIRRGLYYENDTSGKRAQGHASLICSYANIDGDLKFMILDPWPVNEGEIVWLTYKKICCNVEEGLYTWFWDGIVAAYIGSYGTLTPMENEIN